MSEFRDNEHFYDEHIAPMLFSLAKQCEARGISFLALVEFAPGGDTPSGRTESLAVDASFAQRMAHWSARAQGNVDALMLPVMRWGREHGHSSAILSLLGEPPGQDKSLG
jgi:hypothetical protein